MKLTSSVKDVGGIVNEKDGIAYFYITVERGDIIKVGYNISEERYQNIAHSHQAYCVDCGSDTCFCLHDLQESIFDNLIALNAFTMAKLIDIKT